MLIANRNQDAERREAELESLRAENAKLRAIVEYIGAMDYPEILDEVEEEGE